MSGRGGVASERPKLTCYPAARLVRRLPLPGKTQASFPLVGAQAHPGKRGGGWLVRSRPEARAHSFLHPGSSRISPGPLALEPPLPLRCREVMPAQPRGCCCGRCLLGKPGPAPQAGRAGIGETPLQGWRRSFLSHIQLVDRHLVLIALCPWFPNCLPLQPTEQAFEQGIWSTSQIGELSFCGWH